MPAVTDSIPETTTKNDGRIADRTTRKFYDQFKKKRKAFYDLTSGIDDQTDIRNKERTDETSETNHAKQVYVSLLLHRLMFCYFLQKKGLLDENIHYLRDKLRSQPSFYSNFLVRFFKLGLSSPERNDQLHSLFGNIPFLSEGLFEEHETERKYTIEIDNKAFEDLFSFFDEWEWQSAKKTDRSENALNPDIIGHIFEKYINDRAQMGAYYTNEDITDYISRNCILPWLFEETERYYPGLFDSGGTIRTILKASKDSCVFDAVKHGQSEPLPSEIEAGIKKAAERKDWNNSAPALYGLFCETWRDIIGRREHLENVMNRISNEAVQINDFITFNLNIKKFTKQIIEGTHDAQFLETFYKSLCRIKILDPTCGSGAFLLAAINILQPLHESCIRRMEKFIQSSPDKTYEYFEKVLEEVHSPKNMNHRYCIIKNIIKNNIFGVDIMQEAVETAKLRLLIRLISAKDASDKAFAGLDPVSSLYFNLYIGNTLIGFASRQEMIQITGTDSIDLNKSDGKDNLNAKLNKLLFEISGENNYESWRRTHQPFNWLVQFPDIIDKRRGFDIIIGNPPYVEYGNELRSRYTLKNYQTLECGNLHAFTTERCLTLLNQYGRLGLIVPLPAISTARMTSLQSMIKPGNHNTEGRTAWISSFDERPAGLFNGVDQRLSIKLFSGKTHSPELYTTGINRWASASRDKLFTLIRYTRQTEKERVYTNSILKLKDPIEHGILEKFYANHPIGLYKSNRQTAQAIYYRTAGGRYWKVVLNRPMGTGTVSEKAAYLKGLDPCQAVALISSSTFWWYYSTHFDMYNLKDYMIFGFRFSHASESLLSALNVLGKVYLRSLEDNAVLQDIKTKTKGTITQKIYVVNRSKEIIDDIDRALGAHYGFSDNELDHIINYDIKFRMP